MGVWIRRRLLVVVLIVCVLFGLAGVRRSGHEGGKVGVAEAQDRPAAGVAQIWDTPLAVDGFRSASLSFDGAYFVVVSGRRSQITVHQQSGRTVWSRSVPGVNTAVVTADGQAVVAFAALDPTRAGVTILQGPKGQAVTAFSLDGAIWDVQTSADGKLAAVVTGNHSLYLFNLKGKPLGRRWAIDGAGNSVAISPDASYVVVGTWDESGVACYDPKGNTVWSYRAEDDQHQTVVNRLFEAQIAQKSPVVLGVSYANARHTDATVYLWSSRGHGQPLWHYDLDANASEPKARITADGRAVVLTFVREIAHGDRRLQERRLVILDRLGETVRDIGGSLLKPNLVTVSADGSNIVISDGQNALYTVSADGHITPAMVLPGLIYQTIASDDGRLVLVYTSDGKLDMIKVG